MLPSASEAFEWTCTRLGGAWRGECLAVGERDGRVALICVIKRRDFSAQCARLPDIACAHIDERVYARSLSVLDIFAFEHARLSMLSAIFRFCISFASKLSIYQSPCLSSHRSTLHRSLALRCFLARAEPLRDS